MDWLYISIIGMLLLHMVSNCLVSLVKDRFVYYAAMIAFLSSVGVLVTAIAFIGYDALTAESLTTIHMVVPIALFFLFNKLRETWG